MVFLCHNFQMRSVNKEDTRKRLRLERSQLSNSSQQKISALIIEQIKQSDVFKQATNIAFYHAVRGEADPLEIAKFASSKDKHFFLPLVSDNKNQGLLFAPVTPSTQYKNNQFSIPEPIVKPNELINAESLDLVIMPLLGFDKNGNRLGMGGGFYDRTFAFKQSGVKKPVLMGFAYDFQEVSTLDAEPWDIGLDMIVTESQFICF